MTSSKSGPRLDISVIIPVFDEEENVAPLHQEIHAALDSSGFEYEILFVDDGSRDDTRRVLRSLQAADPLRTKLVLLRRNCGQTAALSAGLDQARGSVLIPMDGDRQNDPFDIPRLMAKLDEGFDVVSGWRKNRQDRFLNRRLPSKLANRIIARLSGVGIHDFGCTMKAYRREVLEGVRLYGEMHRFIPIFASWQGGKVTEMVVNHRARTAGVTKYGIGRTWNVILDLILIRFQQRYSQRPIHFFGRVGLYAVLLSLTMFGLMLYYKFLHKPLTGYGAKSFIETPLPLLSVVFFLTGVQSVLLGLVAEMVMRTYYESQAKKTYTIGEIVDATPLSDSPNDSDH
jgi:glycosyltransferase involved in cell wall biosynthesis